MATTPQPMQDYALGMDRPDLAGNQTFAQKIKGPLTPKKPLAPPAKVPFQKK